MCSSDLENQNLVAVSRSASENDLSNDVQKDVNSNEAEKAPALEHSNGNESSVVNHSAEQQVELSVNVIEDAAPENHESERGPSVECETVSESANSIYDSTYLNHKDVIQENGDSGLEDNEEPADKEADQEKVESETSKGGGGDQNQQEYRNSPNGETNAVPNEVQPLQQRSAESEHSAQGDGAGETGTEQRTESPGNPFLNGHGDVIQDQENEEAVRENKPNDGTREAIGDKLPLENKQIPEVVIQSSSPTKSVGSKHSASPGKCKRVFNSAHFVFDLRCYLITSLSFVHLQNLVPMNQQSLQRLHNWMIKIVRSIALLRILPPPQ